jgi:hypothetical protein
MAKRAKYVVHLDSGHIARFSYHTDALDYGRLRSHVDGITEVSAPDGLIGQFENGRATPEFAHLDAERGA